MRPNTLHSERKCYLSTLITLLLFLAIPFSGQTQCGGDVLIMNESFESGWGIWNDGGGDCSRSTSNANTGSYTIDIQDNSGVASSTTTDNIDLSSYTSITVSFSYMPISMEGSEDFWLQISTTGGSSFTTVKAFVRNVDFTNNNRENPSITIPGPFTSNTQLRFRCDASGNGDDIYLDDIVICAVSPAVPCTGGISSFPYTEGFESGFGAWSQVATDDFDWLRLNTNTPSSGTGPTSANEGSYYMYVESSSPNYSNKTTIIEGPCIDLTSETGATFDFDYHMYGGTVGTLDFQVSTNSGVAWTTEWTLSGNQGNAWNNASVDISAYDGQSINVRFVGTTSTNWDGDMAVDDISLTVSSPNTAPIAVADPATSNTEAITIDVLSNDSDPDGDNITITAITVAPNHGASASINNNGTAGNPADDYIDFAPTGAYFGVETFTYQICDDATSSLCATATVSVTISPNTAPNAIADPSSVDISSSVNINVMGNDNDPNVGQTITLTSIPIAPNHGGSAVINNNGTPSDPSDDYIDFTPSGSYVGTETFSYRICDNGTPNLCSNATVTVNVTTSNNAPIANTDPTTSSTEAIQVDVLNNDSDPDGDNITITAITVAPNHSGIATINNNGTVGNPADDYIDFYPTGAYFGVESFTYQICDDGLPSFCATAVVNVTISPNAAPIAVADNSTTSTLASVAIDVLSNDSDPNSGQSITLTSITTPPNNGGSAVINNNGTPTDPTDDFVDFTPSGAYVGVETFTYQICDDGKPLQCATATVSVTISSCPDGSTPETSASFAFGSEWKYDDSGSDLGNSWRTPSFIDACWAYGNSKLGFGDPMTTTISNHGKVTYYFRKHFNVADASAINYLQLDLVRDDGAVVYINGNEVLRSNMSAGTINFATLASSNVSGSSETKTRPILVTASHLVDGDNVIAVEIHQDLPGSSDIHFDMAMTPDIVDHSSDIYVAQGQSWNYSDDGTDLGSTWKTSSYTMNTEDWEVGDAELGYGDGDEVTTLSSSTVYPTYYFRHYFNADDIALTDSLKLKLRKDDGAVVYINGTEVYRHGMASGAVAYGDYANFTASGADETNFYDTTFMASMISSGINVVSVEVHQVSNTSSDVSFEFELSRSDGDPNGYALTYETVSGKVFLDLDVDKALGSGDAGQGALEVFCYQDRDLDGEIDPASDPRLYSGLTDAEGNYELNTYYAEVQSVKSDITASNEDAGQDGLGGTMSLTKDKHKSVISFLPPTALIDTVSTWSYYEDGDHGDADWADIGYGESGWKSGTADFGFGDPGITTTLKTGKNTYYFRKSFLGGASAASWNSARIKIKRDDGYVIYLNGTEIARNNLPEGTILYGTEAIETIQDSEEDVFLDIVVTGLSFNITSNVLAVEIHQRGATSSDTRFDMMLAGEKVGITDVGYRFSNVAVPQGAKIIDAFMRVTSASTTETINTIDIEGQNADNASVFTNAINNIGSRPRTTANTSWSNTLPFQDGKEVKITGLKNIVQEITDRSGWSSGNAMAFFLSGFEKEIYSIDGGYAPELTVSYLDTNQTTIQYVLAIDAGDLPEVYTYMTDGSPSITVGSGSRVANVNIGYIGTTSMCVASSDDDYDALHVINRFSGKNKKIGEFGGSTEIEAIAMSRNADSLFAVDADEFGLIDLATGAFTPYGSVIGTADGADGSQNLNDVDGLAFDLTRNILWATERRTAPTNDLIFLINVTTGQFIPDAFGPGVDYIVAQGGGLLPDLDDIAVNPNTGNLFAMNNNDGTITNLVEIDVATGTPNVINPTGLNDMEGQGFHNDGLFYSTSGREGTPDNAFYRVDTATSVLNLVGYFVSDGDFEGCDCKTGPSVNFVDGYVFEDLDGDSIYTEGVDPIDPGVDVNLYRDVDSNGVFSIGDILVETKISDAGGYYAFGISEVGYYILVIDTADIPAAAELVSEENQDARFGVNGQAQLGNNFGWRNGNLLPVELAMFEGKNDGQINNLFWTTTAEINNDYFDVQRSADAINFETIGQVDGAGNSTNTEYYTFVDDEPYIGINYYRLLQVDFDGTSEYSKTISLEVGAANGGDKVSLDVWPNPAPDFIKIGGLSQIEEFEEITIQVFDVNGVVRYSETLTIDSDVLEIDINDFENGLYLTEVTSVTKGLIQSLNFVKQD